MFYNIRFSYKLCNIHRKLPLLESLFNKVAGLKLYNFIKKRLQDRYFLVNITKFLILLIANHTKWSNTLKQFVGKLLANCLSVFAHFMKLAFKGLRRPAFFEKHLRRVTSVLGYLISPCFTFIHDSRLKPGASEY